MESILLIAYGEVKYPIAEELGLDCSSMMAARLTSKIISLFGVPHTVISDNGPQF